jgi:type IV conjugative transfer system lipoprotein TraV
MHEDLPMFRKLMIITAPLLVLSGCMTTPPYTCKLGEFNPDCHTMQQVYGKAKTTPGQTGGLEQIMRPDPTHPLPPPAPPMPLANHGGAYAEPGEVGKPVFQEPQVHRVWIAPYVDANGNLRSGEYTYFNTPGQWNYGTTTAQGSAAASTMFAPVKGGNGTLGFNPNVKAAGPAVPKQSPPKPQDSNLSALAPQVPAITPPAQKLAE